VAWDEVVLRAAPKMRTAPPAVGTAPRIAIEPELAVWRAPTDNDGIKQRTRLAESFDSMGGPTLARWLRQGLDHLPADQLVRHEVRREVTAAGIEFHHTVVVPDALADLPRVGVRFTVPGRFRHFRWCGRGPHENYPDRNRSAVLGVWEGGPDEFVYVVPQEFGLRTDTRWLELADPRRGDVLRIDVLQPTAAHVPALHWSATHFTADDLWPVNHVADLRPRKELVVHLDAAHRGLGTNSCGPDTLPEHQVQPGTYRFSYRVSQR
jgi:beta-galactosidase